MPEETATIILKKKTYQVRSGIPLRKAMKLLNLTPNAYLAVREKELITDDELLKTGDQIELVPVISGG